MNASIQDIIQRSDAIPSMPQVVTRLLEITRDPEFKQSEVISLLSADAGVSSDILRLANSALFGVTREIGSLNQALTLLGIKRIRTLVMGRYMTDRVSSVATDLIDASYFWRRSLVTGVLAARFADQLIPRYREEAFMSGLLSQVGVVVLARAFPQKYGPVAKSYGPLQGKDFVQREIQAVGACHPEVSAMVLERWMLPQEMVEAIRHYHETAPDSVSEDVRTLSGIIGGASDIARLLCEVPDKETIASACTEAMSRVGLSTTVLQHVLGEIESDVTEFAEVLKIDVIPSRVYAIIADTISEQLVTAAD